MEESTPVVKKTTRIRKTAAAAIPASGDVSSYTPSSAVPSTIVAQVFDDLMTKLIQGKAEYDNLQKEISQIKQDWIREQKQHESDFAQQKTQEELERKREKETYEYNTSLARKRAEDEFQDKKLGWEKELSQRKEELEDQRKELEQLRKLAADFDNQKESAVKMAQTLLEKSLTEKYESEKRLTDQEVKAEKDILNLKISNLEVDNLRLSKEIEVLKRSLDEASRQVKEIAVKVIESGSAQLKTPASIVDKTS